MSHPHRAVVRPELLDVLNSEYGLHREDELVDLGGSNNLNLHVPGAGLVVRVYAPWTSAARLGAIQHARRTLVEAGLPFADTVSALNGTTFVALDDRVLEVERYVAGESMDIGAGLLHGMCVLGRIHAVLADPDLEMPSAANTAPFPNHVEAGRALAWTHSGTATLRSGNPSADDLRIADVADALATELADAELVLQGSLPRQVVHGDFWDNNVLFRDGEIVVVLDLDFMGERARIDDLALTLYYANSTLGDRDNSLERIAMLRELVDSYDTGLTHKLSAAERAALPYALARTVLGFVGMLAFIHDPPARRRLVGEIAPDLLWSFDLVRRVELWQQGFAP